MKLVGCIVAILVFHGEVPFQFTELQESFIGWNTNRNVTRPVFCNAMCFRSVLRLISVFNILVKSVKCAVKNFLRQASKKAQMPVDSAKKVGNQSYTFLYIAFHEVYCMLNTIFISVGLLYENLSLFERIWAFCPLQVGAWYSRTPSCKPKFYSCSFASK